MHWVAWDLVTRSKKNGGLGIGKLKLVNEALLAKWAWRYRSEITSMWRKVVTACHGKSRKWFDFPCNATSTGVWKNIMRSESKTGIDVNWSWSRAIFSQEEMAELAEASVVLAGLATSDTKDSWKWTLEDSGIFSTSSFKKAASNQAPVDPIYRIWTGGWIPAKCKIFMWRVLIDRIPTRNALARRNVTVDSENCAFCGVLTESVDHLFSGCETVCAVWVWLSDWAKINPLFAFSFKDVMLMHKGASEDKRARLIIRGLIMVTCWCVWKARNNKIFSNGRGSVEEIIGEVKSLDFFVAKVQVQV
ncbi:uncharacterized protein LOC118481762 [Helianthus annuus]|uniref:uncharacterized protein LOC118481762 n=1 Tax=Helianthus annuus TaxID=4232 RepID=UPI001652FD1B|nr:uncharacterized protein LOC118481762 [Helianthus annuus]